MDEEDLSQVSRTIKDYVDIAGGSVSLEALKADFKQAYKTTIPYEELGYPDLHSFLFSIRGIHVEEYDDDYYLISSPRKKKCSVAKNDDLDDISNITVQLTNGLVIGDKISKRKITLKSSGNTNLNARKSIIDKMNLYSSSLNESTSNETNKTQNKETFLENYNDTASQTYSDYTGSTSPFSNEITISDQDVFNTANTLDSCNYYLSQPTYLTSSSSNALPSYTRSPYYMLLINFVNKHLLEFPVFETLTNVSPDNDGVTFNTILKVGNDNFISPTYYDLSQSSIYENLLKTAYESLKIKYEIAFMNTEQNVVSCIVEVINSYKTGLNTDFIQAAYIQKYKIAPPMNWINMIESTSLIYIEPLSTQVMMYPYRSFLTITPYSTSLPDRIFPTIDAWNIFISNCVNTDEVWFRILDEDFELRYDILLAEMKKHYVCSVVSNLKSVNVSELYACFYENNWYRAEVISIREASAECRLIDIGIKKEFYFQALFPLNHKFTNTPPLAFCCSMSGLGKYDKMNYVSCQLMKILNNEIAIGKVSTETTHKLCMEIYLKNNAFNVSVNKYFLNKIKNELHVPKVVDVGQIFNIYLLSVDESGTARVQIESGSLQLLKHALDCSSKVIEQDGNKRSFYVTSFLQLDLQKIYLTQMDKSWKRIMIKTLLKENKVNILCIDTGDYRVIDMKRIVHIDSLPDTLIHIAPQCQVVKISMSDETTRKMIKFMNRICSQTDLCEAALLMKILKIENEPVVQLYKRQNHDEMISLKDMFLEKRDQVTSINFVNNLSNILPDNLCFDLFNNVSSSNVIPKLEMKKGSILKTVVLKALSPSNFILKIENHPKFAEFMLDLNNYHSLFSSAAVSKIIIGKCYAIQLENNIWYRGLALYVMEDLKTVIVRLVDFAETVSVPITAVSDTLPIFHLLPSQTVNAKLLNVKPIRDEWTQQDCYRFKEIVYQKVLNCVIVDFTDTLCKVILLDDSNQEEMINVTSVLLNERRAVLEDI